MGGCGESVGGCGLWSLLELEGGFVQLQFIGARVVGRWSELRGGRFSEVRNVLVLW